MSSALITMGEMEVLRNKVEEAGHVESKESRPHITALGVSTVQNKVVKACVATCFPGLTAFQTVSFQFFSVEHAPVPPAHPRS